jgi:hypothetical protein
MTLQYILDNKGNTTGVFIPIEEWESLKLKYKDLQNEESVELSPWQKQIIDHRLGDYYKNTENVEDFDKVMDDIEKSL